MSKNTQQKNNKIASILKKNIYYIILASVLVLAMVFAFVFGGRIGSDANINESNIALPGESVEDVSIANPQAFQLPVLNPNVIRDYSDTNFVSWASLGIYAVHKAVDFAGTADTKVLNIADGKVLSIETNSNLGTVVKVQHSNNIVSVYASLNSAVSVSVGQSIKKGAQIGTMSNSMGNEAELGVHLHFEMLKDGKIVDPNLYLNLTNK